MLVPLEERSSLGLGLSRYGVSSVEKHPDDGTYLDPRPQGLFSVADYLMVAAFSRRFGGTAVPAVGTAASTAAQGGKGHWTLDAGANFNVLYRQLQQDGFGVRADGMVQGTWNGRLRAGALLKGLIPSTATWESGYDEYESPDLFLSIAYRAPAPYFYGVLQAAYQTEGLFQKGAKAQGEAYGSRVFGNPGKALLAGNLGLEFLFDFGLVMRAGLAEIGMDGGTLSSSAFGIGYSWKKMLGIDYSFTPHPDLDASHRIALQFTPAFREFNGRNFRTGGREPAPPIRHPDDSGPETTPEESLEGGQDLLEAPAAGHPVVPAAPASPIAPVAPAPVAPAPVAPAPIVPIAPAAPAPADPASGASHPAAPAPGPSGSAGKAVPSLDPDAAAKPASEEVLEDEVEEGE
jgi:hypothetical protein